jgi:hypothetical protein
MFLNKILNYKQIEAKKKYENNNNNLFNINTFSDHDEFDEIL